MALIPTQLNPNARQVGDGSPDGLLVGSALDSNGNPFKMGFWGATPVAQPSGPVESAVTRGVAGGSIGIVNSQTISASAVGTLVSAEQGLTLFANTTANWNVGTADIVYINKPTAQAGLGVGNVRVSAAGVLGVTLTNFTAATITPTTNQSWGAVVLKGFSPVTGTLSPAAVPPGITAEQTFAVAGIPAGQLLQVIKPTQQNGLDIVGCRVISNGTIGVTFTNVTAATITPTASEAYKCLALGGLDTINNQMLIEETLSLTASTNTVNSANQGPTVTGLATSDVVLGVSKPTAQANFGIVGYFVSAANTLGITIANYAAATVTPTANDVYAISIYRPSPVAPLVLYSPALTPAAIAANTAVEQTFTITGLVASSPVWVNKPSAQAGLGIGGVRVSAANVLAINFTNSTTASITPAAETYLVGNFQVPLGDAGSAWIQTADTLENQQSNLSDAMRAAMVSTGLMAGA